MSISQALLPEYDHEMAGTRKFLEIFPADEKDWAPHEKSMPLVKLASHIAEIPSWVANSINTDSLDVAPADGEPYQSATFESAAAMVEAFDGFVKEGRVALKQVSDEALMQPWALLQTGKTLFSMPKVAVIRSFVMNHIIHHRAQLGVYYRLKDIPVPAVYGPSADDQSF